MQVLKRIFDFYINSSIHVALAVCCLVYVTLLNFYVGVEFEFLFFVFFATITAYNFIKYFGLAKFHHRSLATWLKYIQIFSFLSFLALIYFTLKLPITTLLYFSVLGIVSLLYAIPFLPKRYFIDGKMNLRAISGMKIYVIAFSWSVVTVIIPLLHNNYSLGHDVYVEAIQRFLYVIIVMFPFDIRDMQYDSVKLATIPQCIGVKRTKIIGVLLTLVFFLLEYMKDDVLTSRTYVLLVISALMLLSILFSNINQNKYYSGFWVEGIPIVWAILTIANY